MYVLDMFQIPLLISSVSPPSGTVDNFAPKHSPPPAPAQSTVPYTSRFDPGRELFKKDTCSATLGGNRSDKICSPNKTLCCLDSPNPYPQCQTHFGKGWCVVSGNASDYSFVDQASECGGEGAVVCDPSAGPAKGCCPAGTRCTPGYNSGDGVRCEMRYGDLLKADGLQLIQSTTSSSTPNSTSSSALKTSSTTSTSTLSVSQTTSPTTSQTPSLTTSPTSAVTTSQLSAGTIGGIAVGSVAAAVALIGLGVYLFRRRKPQASISAAHIQDTSNWAAGPASMYNTQSYSAGKPEMVSYENGPPPQYEMSVPPQELSGSARSPQPGPFQLP